MKNALTLLLLFILISPIGALALILGPFLALWLLFKGRRGDIADCWFISLLWFWVPFVLTSQLEEGGDNYAL